MICQPGYGLNTSDGRLERMLPRSTETTLAALTTEYRYTRFGTHHSFGDPQTGKSEAGDSQECQEPQPVCRNES